MIESMASQTYKTSTLKDVALAAGVSSMTVSRAMAGIPGVSVRVRKQIHELADQLGYRPNAAARMMRSRQTGQVGVLIRNAPDWPLHYPAAYEFILGINERLEAEGYVLTLVRINDVLGSRKQPSRVFQEHMLDGVIVIDSLPTHVYERVEALSPQCIWLETNVWREENCIRRDEVHAGRLVGEQLIALGHRRLIWMSSEATDPKIHFSFVDRLAGLRQAAEAVGIEVEEMRYAPGWIETRGGKVRLPPDPAAFRKILKPDCGVVASGEEGLFLAYVAATMGLRPGFDFGLAACDVEYASLISMPNISYVMFDRFSMGRRAAEMMLKRLRHPEAPCPSVRIRGEWHAGSTAWGPGESSVQQSNEDRASRPSMRRGR